MSDNSRAVHSLSPDSTAAEKGGCGSSFYPRTIDTLISGTFGCQTHRLLERLILITARGIFTNEDALPDTPDPG